MSLLFIGQQIWHVALDRRQGSDFTTYTYTHNLPLYDFADIISHDPGHPCYENRDGDSYHNRSENHPDDRQSTQANCQHYITETDGGHLGAVSGGKVLTAKAFWVLMSQIADWNPSQHSISPTASPLSSTTPTPISTPNPSSTPFVTITPTPAPTTTASSTPAPTTLPTSSQPSRLHLPFDRLPIPECSHRMYTAIPGVIAGKYVMHMILIVRRVGSSWEVIP